MDLRTLVAFLVGVALTTSAFLLFRDGQPIRTDPIPASDPAPRGEPAAEITPSLEGARTGPLGSLSPSREEIQWITTALTTERRRRDAARIRAGDTGLSVMARIFNLNADPAPLFRSYEAFRAPIVESEETALVISEPRSGETISFRDGDVDRVVIELGPGVFPLDEKDQHWRPVYTQDAQVSHVVIRGAGMDRTTLVAGHQFGLIQVGGQVEHLVIRDLTLDGSDAEGALLDVRGKAAVALENVRVSGWKVAGHAAAVGVSGSAYLGSKNCEFRGRGQQSGWAISLRGRSLVLCEGCRFLYVGSGALIGSGREAAGGAAMLRDCTFVDSRLCDREFTFPVRVLGGRVMYGASDLSEDQRRSQWGGRNAERVEGVVFEPVPPVCTLGALLDVLQTVTAPVGEQIVAIRLDGVVDGKPSQFRVFTLPAEDHRTKAYVADVSHGRPRLRHLEKDPGCSIPPADVVRRAKSFVEVLRNSTVPLDTSVSELQYSWQTRDRAFPTLAVSSRGRWNRWYFNAESGELLHGPK